MDKLFGIENLKKGVKLALGFTEQTVTSLKDGFQYTDLLSYLDELMEVPGVVKAWSQIIQEAKDLDADERKELAQYVADNFDIPDDKIEAVIEHSLQWLVETIALYEQWKEIKNK